MSEGNAWTPTHTVPATGAACWASPDRSQPALEVRLDPELEVRDIETVGEWMRVECSNGWSTWVDRQGFAPIARAVPEVPEASVGDGQFSPTHRVPASGLAAYETHDTSAEAATLDPNLSVQVVERWGDWAHILCSNAWSAWVDGRMLEAIASPAVSPTTPTRNPVAAALRLLVSAPRTFPKSGPLRDTGIIPVFGAALIIAGTFLPLLSFEGYGSLSAWDASATYLWSNSNDPTSLKLAIPLIVGAALVALPLLIRRPLPPLMLLILAAPATNAGVHMLVSAVQTGFVSSLGAGLYMVSVGGLLIVVEASWSAWQLRRSAFH